MKKIKLIVLLSLGCLFVGCSGMSSTVDGKTYIFTQQQKCPILLEMDVNQTVELTLKENPSTGYGWSLEDPLKLFKVEETYISDAKKTNDSAMLGQGGNKIFKFRAIQPGEEVIKIRHARAWENETSIDEWVCRIRIS
ncbi:protease inhibitor I42 family protein [Acinetobacter equi]|uniref:Proteinase inhibitor I42 chagasin domain-containing protein n=1 Tax=Acinetobacter equi TaxID=1324350 RepID=A0A0N9VZ27_9GAMM|nr:protease inhibitor I42 family protein [Acinetobacter equi]ALH94513.1 hypothetical protein AOY20_02575 [Acinetobacter equi]